MSPKNVFVAAVAVIAITVGAWLSYKVTSPAPEPRALRVLPQSLELPDFALLDHTGEAISREIFKGQWDLVFFGFTHCPDVCPLTLQTLANAKKKLADAGHSPLPRIVLVSVDPERDTPDLIGRYVGHFGSDTLGITGDIEEVRKFTDGLGVFFEKSPLENGDYTVDHAAYVMVIDPAGRFSALFGTPHEADNFVHDLPLLMEIM